MRLSRPRLVAILIAVVLGSIVPFIALGRDVPEIDVRARPWLLPVGKVFSGHAPGQSFRSSSNTLDRIDVALVLQSDEPDQGLELVLRDGGPDGEILRTVVQEVGAAGERDFHTFDFEDIGGARGRTFHFSLRPAGGASISNWSPWTSYRGRMGPSRPWGDRFVDQPIEVDFGSYHDELCAIAIATDGLNVPAGECRLDLYRQGATSGPPLRVGTLAHKSPIAAGYALFTFEPIERSRARMYTFRVTLPPDARMVGNEDGVSCMNFHGRGTARPELIGMTYGTASFRDRDLIFRSWGDSGLSAGLQLVAERGGRTRLLWAGLLSIVANAVILAFFITRGTSGAKQPA